jgi:hypothetical protein
MILPGGPDVSMTTGQPGKGLYPAIVLGETRLRQKVNTDDTDQTDYIRNFIVV